MLEMGLRDTMKKIYSIMIPALLLSGCTSLPPLDFAPPNVGLSRVKQDASLVSTSVTTASKADRKGQIDIAGAENDITSMWKTALEDTMVRMAIFRDDSANKLSLAVKILKADVPSAGFSMTTRTIARYELINRNTGDIVFSTEVEADGSVPMGDNFYGIVRARNSLSLAVQNNISTFLQQLESADLTKPMFPAEQQAGEQ
jgi:PBP1b-binding outer membrane lipoprotein LpoB